MSPHYPDFVEDVQPEDGPQLNQVQKRALQIVPIYFDAPLAPDRLGQHGREPYGHFRHRAHTSNAFTDRMRGSERVISRHDSPRSALACTLPDVVPK
jgi:hypothetical protein